MSMEAFVRNESQTVESLHFRLARQATRIKNLRRAVKGLQHAYLEADRQRKMDASALVALTRDADALRARCAQLQARIDAAVSAGSGGAWLAAVEGGTLAFLVVGLIKLMGA